MTIDEVVEGGPFDKKISKVVNGCIIEAIDGEDVKAEMDYFPMLNNKAGKQVLVAVYNPETGERWTEIVKPISHGAMNELLYNRWVKRNEEAVDKLSDGRLGYVHIKSMGDASYRDVYSQILGKYNLRDGIVIDTRFNGGAVLARSNTGTTADAGCSIHCQVSLLLGDRNSVGIRNTTGID